MQLDRPYASADFPGLIRMDTFVRAQLLFAEKLRQFVVEEPFQKPSGIAQRRVAQCALDPGHIQITIANLPANQIEGCFGFALARVLCGLGFFLAPEGWAFAAFSAIWT